MRLAPELICACAHIVYAFVCVCVYYRLTDLFPIHCIVVSWYPHFTLWCLNECLSLNEFACTHRIHINAILGRHWAALCLRKWMQAIRQAGWLDAQLSAWKPEWLSGWMAEELGKLTIVDSKRTLTQEGFAELLSWTLQCDQMHMHICTHPYMYTYKHICLHMYICRWKSKICRKFFFFHHSSMDFNVFRPALPTNEAVCIHICSYIHIYIHIYTQIFAVYAYMWVTFCEFPPTPMKLSWKFNFF